MEYANLELWPKRGDGEPEEAALLTNAPDFAAYGGLVCSILDGFQIPYYTDRPRVGQYSHIVLGFSGEGVYIYVPASRLEEARALLEEAQDPAE